MKIDLKEIIDDIKSFETPFYFYDGDLLHSHYLNTSSQLRGVDMFLSLKANNNISLIKLFQNWGCGVEVASEGELFLALHAGFKPQNIIFSGPGKKRGELKFAIENEIYCIIVESLDELEQVYEISENLGVISRIAVRINPDNIITQSTIKMGGVARSFGIDEIQLNEFIIRTKNLKSVEFKGIHIYLGTQILDAKQILAAFSYSIDIAEKIYKEHHIICEMVDLGGGLGVPYFSHEAPLDFPKLAKRVNELISKARITLTTTRFIIESGRYLLAEGGAYITRVLFTKKSKGELFWVVDGGLHHHAASTFRGRTMRNNFPIEIINQTPESPSTTQKVNIVGPLCTPEDCLLKNAEVVKAEVGDFVCVLNSGAYGLSYSPIYFLGHPTPLEIIKYHNKYTVIREKGKSEDLLLRQSNIDWEI